MLSSAGFDAGDGLGVIAGFQRLGRLGAGVDHEELRLKLAQRPGQFLRFGVFADEVKHRQVAFGVPGHAGIVRQLQQADVTMVILQRLQLELGAILRLELEASALPSCSPRYL